MTPSQKLRSIADSTGLDGIADAIREIANEIEHNNAPAVPQGWPPFDELDDDLIDAACTAGSVLYRVDLMRAYECIRAAMLAATPAPAPAQEVGLTDEQKTWAVNQLMEQAQVFASAWSLVGGRHDFGNALEEAEQAKTELRSMVVEALRAKGASDA